MYLVCTPDGRLLVRMEAKADKAPPDQELYIRYGFLFWSTHKDLGLLRAVFIKYRLDIFDSKGCAAATKRRKAGRLALQPTEAYLGSPNAKETINEVEEHDPVHLCVHNHADTTLTSNKEACTRDLLSLVIPRIVQEDFDTLLHVTDLASQERVGTSDDGFFLVMINPGTNFLEDAIRAWIGGPLTRDNFDMHMDTVRVTRYIDLPVRYGSQCRGDGLCGWRALHMAFLRGSTDDAWPADLRLKEAARFARMASLIELFDIGHHWSPVCRGN